MTKDLSKLDIIKLDLTKRAGQLRNELPRLNPKSAAHIAMKARIEELSKVLEVL